MADFIATVRKSTLAAKLELAALSGTVSASGTTLTFTQAPGLTAGDVVGNATVGYRTITGGSGTSYTVDSAYNQAVSAATFNKQNFAVDPTVAAADIVEFVPPVGFDSTRAEIANDAVNRSFDENEPVLGTEAVTGSITVNLHGSQRDGTNTAYTMGDAALKAPETDALWQSAVGEVSTTAATTTSAGCTSASLVVQTFAAGTFMKGQHLLIDPAGSTAYQVVRITAADSGTKTLTISPALTSAPAQSIQIGAGVHYRTTLTELHSIWVEYWRGDLTREIYKGNKCNGVSLDFTVNQSIKPVFSFDGKETGAFTAAACTLGTPSYPDTGDMHVGRYAVLKIGGVSYSASSVKFDLKNELFKREDLTSSGVKSIIRTKRTITGSITMLYESKNFQDQYQAGDTAELLIVSSDGAATLTPGNTFAASFPKIRLTKAGVTESNGLYQYDLQWKAVRTSGEDAMYVSFL